MGAPVASGTLAGSTSGSSASIRKEAASSDLSRFRRHPPVTTRTTLPTSRSRTSSSGTTSQPREAAEGDRRHRRCEIRPWGRAAERTAGRLSAAAGCGERTVRWSPTVTTTRSTRLSEPWQRHGEAEQPREPKQSCRAQPAHAWIWAIGAARDSAVGAVRRHLGTSIDARADYCFDPGASTKAASTRCALVAICETGAAADSRPAIVRCRAGIAARSRVAVRTQKLRERRQEPLRQRLFRECGSGADGGTAISACSLPASTTWWRSCVWSPPRSPVLHHRGHECLRPGCTSRDTLGWPWRVARTSAAAPAVARAAP